MVSNMVFMQYLFDENAFYNSFENHNCFHVKPACTIIFVVNKTSELKLSKLYQRARQTATNSQYSILKSKEASSDN